MITETSTAPPEPGYFSRENLRFRALDLAIRANETLDKTIERADKYAEFLSKSA